MLNFCANNYLGLSSHPEVVQAGIEALKTHGAGLSSVRFICGTQVCCLTTHHSKAAEFHKVRFVLYIIYYLQDLHKKLEQKLAEFHQREDCILYASCFDANAGLFEVGPHLPDTKDFPRHIRYSNKLSPHQVLLGPDDAVLSDELNHASIIDGIRLCRAQRLRYKHMDLSDLESKLKEAQVCVSAAGEHEEWQRRCYKVVKMTPGVFHRYNINSQLT